MWAVVVGCGYVAPSAGLIRSQELEVSGAARVRLVLGLRLG